MEKTEAQKCVLRNAESEGGREGEDAAADFRNLNFENILPLGSNNGQKSLPFIHI